MLWGGGDGEVIEDLFGIGVVVGVGGNVGVLLLLVLCYVSALGGMGRRREISWVKFFILAEGKWQDLLFVYGLIPESGRSECSEMVVLSTWVMRCVWWGRRLEGIKGWVRTLELLLGLVVGNVDRQDEKEDTMAEVGDFEDVEEVAVGPPARDIVGNEWYNECSF